MTSDNEAAIERRQIGICRVLCIFFMMSVHVPPGLEQPSAVTAGTYALVGQVWGEFLGRASVATLSFISGYLLWRSLRGASLGTLAVRKSFTLIVPMLTWNVVMVALLAAAVALTGEEVARLSLDSASDILAAFTGLTGPTANLSLFFLRDLFVASLLVGLLASALGRFPVLTLAALVGVALFDLGEPLVFRPTILVFVAAGLVAAQRVERLAGLCRPRLVLPALATALAGYALVAAAPGLGEPGEEVLNLLLRSMLVLMVLPLALWLAGTDLGTGLLRLERRIFETYLIHLPLISVLWVPWRYASGPATAGAYVVFFALAPVAALAAAAVLGAIADRLPRSLQIALRGKALSAGIRPAPALRNERQAPTYL